MAFNQIQVHCWLRQSTELKEGLAIYSVKEFDVWLREIAEYSDA